jgi:hypothetical protein
MSDDRIIEIGRIEEKILVIRGQRKPGHSTRQSKEMSKGSLWISCFSRPRMNLQS